MALLSAIKRDIRVFAAVTVVTAASFTAVLFLFFLPALKVNLALLAKVRQNKTDLDKISMNIKKYGTLEAQIKSLDVELERKKNKLFWEMGVGGFLSEITHMAADLPIEFISIAPQAPLTPAKQGEDEIAVLNSYKEVPILVELKGDYPSLIQFLSKIEGADKTITVKKLEITPGTQDIFKHTVRMSLMIFSKTG